MNNTELKDRARYILVLVGLLIVFTIADAVIKEAYDVFHAITLLVFLCLGILVAPTAVG